MVTGQVVCRLLVVARQMESLTWHVSLPLPGAAEGPKSQWVNKYSPMMLAIQNSWTVAEFPAFTLRSTASPPVTVLILQAVGVPSDPSG